MEGVKGEKKNVARVYLCYGVEEIQSWVTLQGGWWVHSSLFFVNPRNPSFLCMSSSYIVLNTNKVTPPEEALGHKDNLANVNVIKVAMSAGPLGEGGNSIRHPDKSASEKGNIYFSVCLHALQSRGSRSAELSLHTCLSEAVGSQQSSAHSRYSIHLIGLRERQGQGKFSFTGVFG